MSFQLIYVCFFFFLTNSSNLVFEHHCYPRPWKKANLFWELLGYMITQQRERIRAKSPSSNNLTSFSSFWAQTLATLSSYTWPWAQSDPKKTGSRPPPPQKKGSGLKSKLTKIKNKGRRKTHMILCFNF